MIYRSPHGLLCGECGAPACRHLDGVPAALVPALPHYPLVGIEAWWQVCGPQGLAVRFVPCGPFTLATHVVAVN